MRDIAFKIKAIFDWLDLSNFCIHLPESVIGSYTAGHISIEFKDFFKLISDRAT